MASNLETAIARYRALVLQADVSALTALEAAYTDALDRLRPMIALVQAEIAGLPDGEDAANALFRLQRYRLLTAQLEDELTRLSRLATYQTLAEQRTLTVIAVEAAEAFVGAQSAQLLTSWVRVPTLAVESVLGALERGSPLAALFDRIGPDALELASKALTDGLVRGRHPTLIADAIEKAINVSKVRAMTIARTESLRAYREASLRQYQDPRNRELLRGYRWTSAKNGSVCGACLSRDGAVYSVDRRMETHPNCRCAMTPVLIGIEMPIESGEVWLKRQSSEVQNKVLGSQAAGDAYRAGEVELADFVRVQHNDSWGDSYQADSLVGAKARAERRTRRVAA